MASQKEGLWCGPVGEEKAGMDGCMSRSAAHSREPFHLPHNWTACCLLLDAERKVSVVTDPMVNKFLGSQNSCAQCTN